MSEVVLDCCPYCGTRQVGDVDQDEYYRCHGCNFHIRADWLVDDPEDYVLNADRQVLCPWCGYPAGLEQEIPREDEFTCGGCAGTLIADMLVSQSALLQDRDSGARFRNLFLLLVIVGVLILFMVTSIF